MDVFLGILWLFSYSLYWLVAWVGGVVVCARLFRRHRGRALRFALWGFAILLVTGIVRAALWYSLMQYLFAAMRVTTGLLVAVNLPLAIADLVGVGFILYAFLALGKARISPG
ncbi:MAG: hypothetical protein WBC55_03170 [Dehalococcoidia bacterium]